MPPAPRIPRPTPSEHPAEYGAYLACVPGDDALAVHVAQADEVQRLLAGRSEAQALHRYAPGRWSVKQVLGHLCDQERVFAYRLLRFARSDATPLANFEEDHYARTGRFDRRPLDDLREEFRTVREATLSLLRSLDEEALLQQGVARGLAVSVRALAWVTAGHAAHHLRVLRERYGLA